MKSWSIAGAVHRRTRAATRMKAADPKRRCLNDLRTPESPR
jgi:hypothetical protein